MTLHPLHIWLASLGEAPQRSYLKLVRPCRMKESTGKVIINQSCRLTHFEWIFLLSDWFNLLLFGLTIDAYAFVVMNEWIWDKWMYSLIKYAVLLWPLIELIRDAIQKYIVAFCRATKRSQAPKESNAFTMNGRRPVKRVGDTTLRAEKY